MFIGKYDNQIDDKQRCIIPADFRHDLGENCVLVKWDNNSMFLFPEEEYKKYINERIESRPDEDADAADLKIDFYSDARKCKVDKQGRIKVPEDFIADIGIVKKLVNVGYPNRILICSKEYFDSKKAETAPKRQELFASMNKYNPKP